MESSGVFQRVGGLIVLGLMLLLGLVWFLGGGRFRHGELYESYFKESVQGLDVGAPVKYRGVTVGRVTAIGLVSAEYGHSLADMNRSVYREVFVRYLVDTGKIGPIPNLGTAIRLGLRARIVSQVLTGVGDIELDYVDPAFYPVTPPPWRPEAAYIPSVPSTFTQVQDAAQALLGKLDKIDLDRLTGSVQTLVDSLQRELVSGDLHTTLTDAQALLRTTRSAVQGADLPGLSAALRAVAANPALARTLTNSAAASGQLVRLAGQMSALATRLQAAVAAGTQGAAELNARLAPILRNLDGAAANLRATTDSLRQYPGQLLSGPPPPDQHLAR